MAHPGGRPTTPIDWQTFDNLCAIHATLQEIAHVLGVGIDTLERACKRERGKRFRELYKEKSAGGKVSLRRVMWDKAVNKEDNQMLMWLSRNHLGMRNDPVDTSQDEDPGTVKIVWKTNNPTNIPKESFYDKVEHKPEDVEEAEFFTEDPLAD